MAENHSDTAFAASREIVRPAIRAAFGFAWIDAIIPITGGASGAVPFRVEIGDRRYLVRVESLAAPGLDAAV